MDIFDILGLDDSWPYGHLRYAAPAILRQSGKTAPREAGASRHVSTANLAEAANRDYDLSIVWKPDAEQPTIKAYTLRVVIAPFKKKEVSVQLDAEGLEIQACEMEDTGPEGPQPKIESLHAGVSEEPFRVYLPFERLVAITQAKVHKNGVKILTDDVKATVEEGVLKVYIPVGYVSTSRTVPLG